MSDYLERLLARALSRLVVVQPVVGTRFGPEPSLRGEEDGPEEGSELFGWLEQRLETEPAEWPETAPDGDEGEPVAAEAQQRGEPASEPSAASAGEVQDGETEPRGLPTDEARSQEQRRVAAESESSAEAEPFEGLASSPELPEAGPDEPSADQGLHDRRGAEAEPFEGPIQRARLADVADSPVEPRPVTDEPSGRSADAPSKAAEPPSGAAPVDGPERSAEQARGPDPAKLGERPRPASERAADSETAIEPGSRAAESSVRLPATDRAPEAPGSVLGADDASEPGESRGDAPAEPDRADEPRPVPASEVEPEGASEGGGAGRVEPLVDALEAETLTGEPEPFEGPIQRRTVREAGPPQDGPSRPGEPSDWPADEPAAAVEPPTESPAQLEHSARPAAPAEGSADADESVAPGAGEPVQGVRTEEPPGAGRVVQQHAVGPVKRGAATTRVEAGEPEPFEGPIQRRRAGVEEQPAGPPLVDGELPEDGGEVQPSPVESSSGQVETAAEAAAPRAEPEEARELQPPQARAETEPPVAADEGPTPAEPVGSPSAEGPQAADEIEPVVERLGSEGGAGEPEPFEEPIQRRVTPETQGLSEAVLATEGADEPVASPASTEIEPVTGAEHSPVPPGEMAPPAEESAAAVEVEPSVEAEVSEVFDSVPPAESAPPGAPAESVASAVESPPDGAVTLPGEPEPFEGPIQRRVAGYEATRQTPPPASDTRTAAPLHRESGVAPAERAAPSGRHGPEPKRPAADTRTAAPLQRESGPAPAERAAPARQHGAEPKRPAADTRTAAPLQRESGRAPAEQAVPTRQQRPALGRPTADLPASGPDGTAENAGPVSEASSPADTPAPAVWPDSLFGEADPEASEPVASTADPIPAETRSPATPESPTAEPEPFEGRPVQRRVAAAPRAPVARGVDRHRPVAKAGRGVPAEAATVQLDGIHQRGPSRPAAEPDAPESREPGFERIAVRAEAREASQRSYPTARNLPAAPTEAEWTRVPARLPRALDAEPPVEELQPVPAEAPAEVVSRAEVPPESETEAVDGLFHGDLEELLGHQPPSFDDGPRRGAETPTPSLEIHIGRIEVRTEPPSLEPPPAESYRPRLSLDEYLRQRRAGLR